MVWPSLDRTSPGNGFRRTISGCATCDGLRLCPDVQCTFGEIDLLKHGCAILALVTLAACIAEGTTGSALPDRVVDDSFGGGQLVRRGGRALQYAVSISELEGKYVVCAAINNARDSLDGQAIRALDVTANDQVIVNGLGWAPRYNTVSLEGSRASCRLTGVAVIPGARLDTDLSRNRFRG